MANIMMPRKDPIYKVWDSMKRRCSDTKNSYYHRYGGRGIKVCDRWAGSFDAFKSDMGDRPPGYSIDRIDNDGDYCPENCKWSSNQEQSQNKSSGRNTSGVKGVKKASNGWRAGIVYNGKEIYLGRSKDIAWCAASRAIAEDIIFRGMRWLG